MSNTTYSEKASSTPKQAGDQCHPWRRALQQRLGRRCRDLLPTHAVLPHLDLATWRDGGLQHIPLDKIVGSTGRYLDFDLHFRPRRPAGVRLANIAQARAQGITLPPIRVFQVGDVYFVEDGNHRVATGRARGETTIEAQVLELDASPLQKEPTCTRLGYKV